MAEENIIPPETGEGYPNPFENGQMPTLEQVLAMLDGMEGIDEAEKEEIRKNLVKRAMGGAANMFGGAGAGGPMRQQMAAPNYFVFVAMILILLAIFGKKTKK